MKMLPKQRLSFSQKSANDFEWAKEVIDALTISYSIDSNHTASDITEFQRMLSNYQLYNNKLNQQDFERECNPLGLSIGQFQDTIQPYNKTYNKIQVLLGEEYRRPFNFRTILVNSDGIKSKLASRDKVLRDYVTSQVQQLVSQLSQSYGVTNEELLPELFDERQLAEISNTSYLDAREILASKILNYLIKKLSVPDLKNDAFKHALISARELVYVGVRNNEPYIEVLNPLGCFYHKSAETKYVQDSLYAGYRTYLTPAEILDRYGPYMSEEDRKDIDDDYKPYGYRSPYPYNDADSLLLSSQGTSFEEGSYGKPSATDILVQHVEWKSQKKVGFLSFVNEYGELQTDIVSEDFPIPPSYSTRTEKKEYNRSVTTYNWETDNQVYSLEWSYIPEVWTGTKIGNDIYVMIGPKKEQFRSMDNPQDVKLGYHGFIYNDMNSEPVSIMDRMKPFQYLYFIIMHKLKKLIAQDNGKIFPFDVSMVDPAIGLEKTLYYLKEMNISFYNPMANADQPGAYQRGTVTGSTDMSNMQNIMGYINLIAAIDQQISDVAGITRQREGQVLPGEAVSNAQSAMAMSAMVTEIYFSAHNKIWQQVLTSVVQIAQVLYKEKPATKQYVLDDLSVATLQITPELLDNSEFGVFISDSAKEEELFQSMKVLSDRLLQANRAKFSDIVRMFKASSIEELERMIVTSEEEQFKQDQAAQQAQLQAQQQMEQERQQHEMQMKVMDQEHEIRIAEIESFKFVKEQDSDHNGIPDQFEVEKFQVETALKMRKLDLEEEKIKKQAIGPAK